MDDGEIDLGLGDCIQQVGETVLGHDRDDLDDFGIVEAGTPDGCDIFVANATTMFGDLGRKIHCASARGSFDAPLRLSAISSGASFAKLVAM